MQQEISQCLDELIDRLHACQPPLEQLDLDSIVTPPFNLQRKDESMHMKGYIGSCLGLVAEEYVRLWLQQCEGIQDPLIELPEQGFYFGDRVLSVMEAGKKRKRAEFDGLFSYIPPTQEQRVDAVVEVKYRRQHGFAANLGAEDAPISRKLRAARIVFGQRPTALLVAFPICSASRSFVRKIEDAYPQVRCLDVWYDHQQVKSMAEVLYLKALATALQEAENPSSKVA